MYSTYKIKYCRQCSRPHSVRVTRCDGQWRDTVIEQYVDMFCECGAELTKANTTYLKPKEA